MAGFIKFWNCVGWMHPGTTPMWLYVWNIVLLQNSTKFLYKSHGVTMRFRTAFSLLKSLSYPSELQKISSSLSLSYQIIIVEKVSSTSLVVNSDLIPFSNSFSNASIIWSISNDDHYGRYRMFVILHRTKNLSTTNYACYTIYRWNQPIPVGLSHPRDSRVNVITRRHLHTWVTLRHTYNL